MIRSLIRWRLVPEAMMLMFPPLRKAVFRPPRSVVCLRPGKLGDMIVATPLFSALKQQGGVTRLAVICSTANETVIRHNPQIDIIRAINFHRLGSVLKTINWLRRMHFDAVIDLTPGFSRTNFLISCLAGRDTVRAGIEKKLAADRYHVHTGNLNSHLTDSILDVGEKLTNASFDRPRPLEIYTCPNDRESAAGFSCRNKCCGPVIGINLSSGNGTRQWAYDHFADLTQRLATGFPAGAKFVLIAVGQQREWAERLAKLNPYCVVAPEFPFLTITEIVGTCALLISCDTALIHVAAARKVPIVGLYTAHAENFSRWAPYLVENEVVQSSSTESVNPIDPETVYKLTMKLARKIGIM